MLHFNFWIQNLHLIFIWYLGSRNFTLKEELECHIVLWACNALDLGFET